MKKEHKKKFRNVFLGFVDMPIRFFIYDCNADDDPIREVAEAEFLGIKGDIEYERHSVYANGVKQICLTKHQQE